MARAIKVDDLINEFEKPEKDISEIKSRLWSFNLDKNIWPFIDKKYDELALKAGSILTIGGNIWFLFYHHQSVFSEFALILTWFLISVGSWYFFMICVLFLFFVIRAKRLIEVFLVPKFLMELEEFHANNADEISSLERQRDLYEKFVKREEETSEKINKVINDFGKILKKQNLENKIFDSEFLPHDKEVIVTAIQIANSKTEESNMQDAFRASLFSLSRFQENVGLEPIREKADFLEEIQKWDLKEDKSIELITEIEKKLDPRLPRFLELAEKDKQKFHEMLA